MSERGPERLFAKDDPLLLAAEEDAPPADLEARILSGAGAPGSGGGSKLGWKLGLGGAVGVGIVVWLMRGSTPAVVAPVIEPPPAVIASAAPVVEEPKPVIEEPKLEPAPVASVSTPIPVRPRPSASVVAAPVASTPPPALGLGAEIKAIDAARASMNAGDPSGALAGLDAYDRDFPQGTLEQEAVLLRIDALMRAGRTEEARKLGHAFLAQSPSTPHKKRILTLLREGE